MKNIIVTGGIGVGKGFVSKALSELMNANLINFDAEWHQRLMLPNVIDDISDTFGRFILDETFNIDRKKLGKIVFSSKEAMGRYMAVIKPHMDSMQFDILERLEENRNLHIIEVPLALDYIPMDHFSGNHFLFLGVFAPLDVQIRRVVSRSKFTLSDVDVKKRMEFQPSPREYMHKCDVCFWNDGASIQELSERLGSYALS